VSEFVVESYFPREPARVVAPRIDEIALAAARMSEEGVQVRLLCATYLLEEEICFYLYESPSADAVREAVSRARLRFERITEAVSVRPALDMDRKATSQSQNREERQCTGS
jgi:hypothetical protein